MGKKIFSWYCGIVASLCMVLFGYDASVFNSLQGSSNWLEWVELGPSDTYLLGLINTSYTIGAIISGFFMGGPLADWAGRRWGMFAGCLTVIVATFIQAFTPRHQISCFIVGRVLIGIGQGLALTAAPVYIGEITPASVRGMVMTIWQMNFSVGSFIAYWVNYACSNNRENLGQWDWRMVVIFQMLVPAIVCSTIFFFPESPRWHVQKNGNIEAARQSLARIRETEQEVEEELLSIQSAIEYEKEALKGITYTALFRDPSIRKRLLLACLLNIGQQLSGSGTLANYSTTIYQQVWRDNKTINLINALNATFGILFSLNAMWTADRYGRRWLFMVGATGMGICMLIVPIVGLKTPSTDGVKSEPVGIAIVFLFFLFNFFYMPSWGAAIWMWTSEVFSMNVRAQAVGMCTQMQNVANTIFQQFFPEFLRNEGLRCLFFFMSINFCLIAFVYFFIPETKMISLEEIDVIFGSVSHASKGADMLGVSTQLPDAKEVSMAEITEEGKPHAHHDQAKQDTV